MASRRKTGGLKLPVGIIDTHVHTAPDVIPRTMTDIELGQAAREANYRAVVLKGHHSLTSSRAEIAASVVGGIELFGGLVLNLHATGGLNPSAVEAAAALGARIVWMPTFTAASEVLSGGGNHAATFRGFGRVANEGISVIDSEGNLSQSALAVLDAIASLRLTLATGHLSAREIMLLVPEARRRGIQRTIVTHPELPSVGLTVEQQLALTETGSVWFERVFAVTLPRSRVPMDQIVSSIRAVGVENTILATDLGQVGDPTPIDGMAIYIEALMEYGLSHLDIEQMVCRGPALALNLAPCC